MNNVHFSFMNISMKFFHAIFWSFTRVVMAAMFVE